MHKVTDSLFIASGEEASNKRLLKKLGIGAIVNCTKDWPNHYEEGKELEIDYLRIPIDDPDPAYEDYIEKAVAWIRDKIARGKKVLVHCAAGRSRSCAVIISYLCSCGMNLNRAWDYMQSINEEFVLRDTFKQIIEERMKTVAHSRKQKR